MTEKRKYDSTVARIAGNIAGDLLSNYTHWGKVVDSDYDPEPSTDVNGLAAEAVAIARAIVAETERTEPVPPLPEVKK